MIALFLKVMVASLFVGLAVYAAMAIILAVGYVIQQWHPLFWLPAVCIGAGLMAVVIAAFIEWCP